MTYSPLIQLMLEENAAVHQRLTKKSQGLLFVRGSLSPEGYRLLLHLS